jgi:hypothetical protein
MTDASGGFLVYNKLSRNPLLAGGAGVVSSTTPAPKNTIGHLSKKKIERLYNDKIPHMTDASGGFLWYNESRSKCEPLGLAFCIIYGTGLGVVKDIEHKPT